MDDPAEGIPTELRDEIRDKFNYLVTQKMPLMSAIVGEILNENPPEVTEGLRAVPPVPAPPPMDVETFCGHVGKLVDQVEGWKRLIEGFRDAEDDAEDAAEEAATFDAITAAGAFMRV